MLATRNVVKLVIAMTIVVCVVLFFVLPVHEYVTLEYIQQQRTQLAELYLAYPIRFIFIYIMIYVLLTGLSIPSATLLTLIGGAVLGTVTGSVVVLTASTIGAVCAFVLARYVLRDYVQTKFSEQLHLVNRGIERDGPFYLFGLRVVPAVPYFVVNLAMALTPIPLRTYYWVTQLGLLPMTVLFVNFGNELGQLDSLWGLLSWSLIFSLIALGVFPLAAKKALEFSMKQCRRESS